MKLVTSPNNILAKKAEPIKKFDAKLKKTVSQMIDILNRCVDPQGVGLAGCQVGLNKALFIIKPEVNSKPQVFINPKIISINNQILQHTSLDKARDKHKKSKRKKKKPGTKLEGCLSIPYIWGEVKRALKVKLKYQDINGKTHIKWFSGFKAIIIQHEIDHLNGMLFTQRVIEQNNCLYKEKAGELHKIEI